MPDQQYFYLQMAVRERWSVRELGRQIESDLFTRCVSVERDPEKCLPAQAEQGGLLRFKDHYLLDFLGLEEPSVGLAAARKAGRLAGCGPPA